MLDAAERRASIKNRPPSETFRLRRLLTHDEEDGADDHAAREHVLRDALLRLAHGPELVGERVGPEVGQQQRTQEEGGCAVAGAPRRLHLSAADGLHVKLQEGHGEDDHPQRQEERRPRLDFTLKGRHPERSDKNIQDQIKDVGPDLKIKTLMDHFKLVIKSNLKQMILNIFAAH